MGGMGSSNLHLPEPWMTDVLLKFRPFFGGHFVDVGINVGQTLVKVHALFDEIKYIGFEPNSSCVHYLQELIKINGLVGYTVLPIAVGAKTEMLKLNFFASDSSDSAASIIERFRPNSKEDHFIYVPVFNFQAVANFLPTSPNSIVKIDVEGAELDVLLGLQDWIKSNQPLILIEILPVYSEKNTERLKRQDRIEELMHTLNYKISRIKKGVPVHLESLDSIGIHSIIEDCDYVFYPDSSKQRVVECFR